MDLSFPWGRSINDMIPTGDYLGSPMRLRYPSVNNLVDMVKLKGRGSALYKRDLSRAFQQFPIDHDDYNLLGFTWRGQIYFDTTLPMDVHTSPFLLQRITSSFRYLYQLESGFDLVNYIDDLVAAEKWDKAEKEY